MIRYIPFIAAAGGGGDPHGLLFFFAINESPSETVTGDPVTERADFLSYLSGTANEPFDSYSVGTSADVTITRNGSTCTVNQLFTTANIDFTDTEEISIDLTISNNTANDRFNTSTTSDRWLDIRVQAGYDFGGPSGPPINRYRVRFEFDVNIAAFGLYGTDFGDFAVGRAINALLTDEDDIDTEHEITSAATYAGGNLIFWGFVDDTKTYKRVIIQVDQAGGESAGEGLGIDDLVFCTPSYLA